MSPEAHSPEPDAPRLPVVQRPVDLSGEVLGGKYRLVRQLGFGGMATIYEAEHAQIGKKIAVKVLDPGQADEPAIERFLLEARAASQLRHPHIIDITDFGDFTDASGQTIVYMVMEFLEGEDLAATLERSGPLPWSRVLAVSKQICHALIAAHDHGIVHCDIKPANVFRSARGEDSDFIKVLDFGVASFACKATGQCLPLAAANDARRKSGPVLGTPGYMPEEQLRGGPYDHRVDIFALGVLMYRLLTNKMPYAGGSLYGPRRPGSGPFPLHRASPDLDVPGALEAVILKSVAADPAERFQSARQLLDALEAVERVVRRSSREMAVHGELQDGSSATMSDAAVARASDSQTELSHSGLSREQVEITSRARPWERPQVHPGLWMLAGFMVSLATTAAVRLLVM